MTDCRLLIQGRDDAAGAAVAFGIITQRPGMNRRAARESFQTQPAGGGVEDLCEAGRTIASRPPMAGGVFDIGQENVATTLQPQRDGVGRAPLVECAGVEKTDQDMKLALWADQLARGAQ